MSRTCIILGAGGHARVLIDSLRGVGDLHVLGLLDPDHRLWGTALCGLAILGGDDRLPALAREGVTHFIIGLGGVGDNGPRRRLFEFAQTSGLCPVSVRHPSAIVSPWATIGDGSQLLPGCIVNAGAALGPNVIANSGAIVEHDCRIGAHAHLATGSRLASGVCVGEAAHVGAGATIRQRVVIGRAALVGAGAVVVADVPDGVTVAGVPARRLEQGT